MSYPTALYLSILSNSVTLITLCYLGAPPTANRPFRVDTTLDGALGDLRAVFERSLVDQTRDATTQTEPTATTEPIVDQPVRRHRHGRRTPYAERLDLNQPWQEVDFTLNGREWGIFSLPELATILHDHYILPLSTRLEEQIADSYRKTELIRSVVESMVTQLDNTIHSTENSAQTIEEMRQHTARCFDELLRRTAQQQQTLTSETTGLTQRLDTQIALIFHNQSRLSRRLSRLEEHLDLDDIEALRSPSTSDDSMVEGTEGNGEELAEVEADVSEQDASVV